MSDVASDGASDPPDEVRALVSAEPGLAGDEPDVVGWLRRLCRAAARSLPATGVGVSVISNLGDPVTVAASDPASDLVEQLQFTLGEGPCRAVCASGRRLSVPDLSAAARSRWPGYAPAAQEHGVQAVFAFPLHVGAARLGALNVYRDRPGPMTAAGLRLAVSFADAAVAGLLAAEQTSGQTGDAPVDDWPETRFEIYQAQGMVQVQLGSTLGEAMARLRAHAFVYNRPLRDVADEVLGHRLTFETSES